MPLENYRRNLNDIVELVHDNGKRFVWISTTPMDEERHNLRSQFFHRYESDLANYNAAALEILSVHGVPVIDLYQFTAGLDGELFRDHVHFLPEVSLRQAAFLRRALDVLI